MAVLEVVSYPDERLKRVSDPVVQFDEALQSFVADLEQTMRASPGAVGIAAPQVGRLQRIVIVDVSSVINRNRTKEQQNSSSNGCMILINPEIARAEGRVVGREGCLSVPDFTGNVARAAAISLTAFDPAGRRHEYRCKGFEARAVQHEADHLDGLLFLDRLVSPRELFRRKIYRSI